MRWPEQHSEERQWQGRPAERGGSLGLQSKFESAHGKPQSSSDTERLQVVIGGTQRETKGKKACESIRKEIHSIDDEGVQGPVSQPHGARTSAIWGRLRRRALTLTHWSVMVADGEYGGRAIARTHRQPEGAHASGSHTCTRRGIGPIEQW